MSVAAWRIRKRVKAMADRNRGEEGFVEREVTRLMDHVLVIIDEELEAEAERQFTRPINPDPTTGMARELKEAK